MSSPHRRFEISSAPPAAPPASRLWTPLIAGPAAWIAQGLLGWYVGSLPCGSMSTGAARVALGAISIGALVIAVAGLLIARTNWLSASPEPLNALNASDRVQFISTIGLLTCAVFIVGIVWAGLTSVFLHDCGRMR